MSSGLTKIFLAEIKQAEKGKKSIKIYEVKHLLLQR